MRLSMVIIPALLVAIAAECMGQVQPPPTGIPPPPVVAITNTVGEAVMFSDGSATTNAPVRVEEYPSLLVVSVEERDMLNGGKWKQTHEFTKRLGFDKPQNFIRARARIMRGGRFQPFAPLGVPPKPNYSTNSTLKVGLPIERIGIPNIDTTKVYLACIWVDAPTYGWWSIDPYSVAEGSYDFQVPSWNRWYWFGLWDVAKGEYVYEKWIGHFIIPEGK